MCTLLLFEFQCSNGAGFLENVAGYVDSRTGVLDYAKLQQQQRLTSWNAATVMVEDPLLSLPS
jgi:hypothetical protein